MPRLPHAAILSRSGLALLLLAPALHSNDWSNNGGNSRRNGLSSEVGPIAADPLWSGGRSSIIAWQPMVVGRRVFLVRQTGFPPSGEPNGSPVVCQDLDTGAELWLRHVPYVAGDWTTWILGASNGLVYASRSGNGSSVSQVVYALDETSGATAWTSIDLIDAGPYDGVVFAPNGDLVVGNQLSVRRIAALDGTTVWSAPRLCNVTSSCGVALHGDGVYVAEPAPGGNVVRKLDLASGASRYQTSVMPGFTLQNTPFVGPDGTLYLSRTQNNPATDFLYAFEDTGGALVQRWRADAGWSTRSEFGCASDGSVLMLDRAFHVRKLHPDTGATLALSADPIATASGSAPHFAVDRSGKVFVSNGGFANGRLYAFDPDLSLRWSLAVPNVNQGGPALGADGTLVIAGVGTNVRALRSSCQVGASAVARNAGANPMSLASTLPILGSTWTATVDLTTTGHASAVLFAALGPIDVPLGRGRRLLCGGLSGVLYQATQSGPLATFTAAVPLDPAMCGFSLCVQAAHTGGVTAFALSNALDLVLGG
jgi:hypothetical protein